MWWSLPLLVACKSPPEVPIHAAPVRLSQVFDGTHWIQAPPATPAPTRVFHDGFEDPDFSPWTTRRKDRSTLSVVAEGSEGSRALQVAAGETARTLPALKRRLPVDPDTLYRLSMKVRTDDLGAPGRDSQGATMGLVERTSSGVKLTHDTQPRLRGDTPWRTLSTTFRTTAETEEVDLTLTPATGRTNGRVLYDDVTLDRLDPLAELGRLPAWTEHARPDPDPHVKGVTLGPDFRPAVVHPTPASWGFTVEVPDPGATLRFAWALGPGSQDETQVCFEVSQATRWGLDRLWDSCVKGTAGRRWTDVALPLDRDTTLVFSARSTQPDRVGHALWADVRVDTAPTVARPNVAILVLDTLRADHLGAYGYDAHPTTPALDALAQRGIRFTQARSPSSWTAPSLGTVVTGRLPSEHRAGTRVLREVKVTKQSAGQRQKNQLSYLGMTLEHPTVGELLAAAGYETVGFQTNYFYSPALGFARGLGRTIRYKGSSLAGARTGLDLVRDWLTARDDDQPFLLSAHFIDPHMPYRMRRPWASGFTPPEALDGVDFANKKPALILRDFTEENRPQKAAIETLYDADIRWLDAALGELIPLLEAQDALIIVLSDHGEAFDEHGHYSHGHGLYDELLRVPLLVRLPGGQLAGAVDDRPASLVDVLPTVLAQAGLPSPEGLAGTDLTGPVATDPEPQILEAMYSGRDRTGLVDGDHKYIYTHPRGYLGFHRAGVKSSGSAHNAREELFDLSVDPTEQDNLVDQEPERTAELRGQVHGWLQRTWPGLHLRCEGESAELVVTATQSVGQISPFSVEPTDGITLDRTRHELTLQLGPDTDWLAVRFLEPGAQITVAGAPVTAGGVAGTRWTLGSSELPDSPPPSPGTGCQVWEVPLSNTGPQDVDDETFAELEALGYVE